MKQLSLKYRLQHYVILVGLAIAIPIITALICAIVAENRASGLVMSVMPSIFFVYFFFGLLFFRNEGDKKYAIAILTGFFSIFALSPLVFFIPVFGSFWAMLIGGYLMYIVLSVSLWEIIYWVLQGIHMRKNKVKQ